MATTLGYAIAHLSPTAEMITIITNAIVFCLFFFSPINFPIENLPGWLASIHQFLPVKYAAELIRGSLAEGYSDHIGQAFLVLAIWVLVGLGAAYRAMTRRR
jgi:ABC-2 type transport system permease protein